MLRPQEGLRLILAVAGLVMLVVAIAYAAPIGALKQFRVPTRNSSPLDITQGSDGNFWFTEGNVLPPQPFGDHNVGRITPARRHRICRVHVLLPQSHRARAERHSLLHEV